MKTAAIVCEYNPFHRGHKHHITETKEYVREKTGEDCAVLCVMSGNFVQRGDVAVCNKFVRAAMAVRCGADLVLELPTPWAMATAEVFARGAVSLIARTGVADFLSFGCETSDIARLSDTARLLLSPDFSVAVKEALAAGVSFAAARQQAVEALRPDLTGLLDKPNNILAIEYLKALSALSSPIAPIAIPRIGQGHDSTDASGSVPCASAIRQTIRDGTFTDALTMLPPEAAELLQREYNRGAAPVDFAVMEPALMSYLRRLTPADYALLPDVSEGLHNRLYDAMMQAATFDDACALAKSKRYSYARIRRLYLAAFLGLRREHTDGDIPYARVLAMSDTGRTLLGRIPETLPVVTKATAVRKLGGDALSLMELEASCTDQYALCAPGFSQRTTGSEWTTSPMYIRRF